MKRVTLSVPFFVLAATTLAYAAGDWDHSGGTSGRFSSADQACKDLIGSGTAYEFAKTTPPDARGFSECYEKARDKGDSKEEPQPIKKGIVYRVEKPPTAPSSKPAPTTATTSKPPPMTKECGADDFKDFPSFQGSALAAHSTGIEADSRIGKCDLATDSYGPRLFVNSNTSVRPDRMYKKATASGGSDHYHLKAGNLIVDTTIFQFFQKKAGFNGLVFVGTDAQLLTALNKLVEKCGINQEKNEGGGLKLGHLVGKSGSELKTILYDGAKPESPNGTRVTGCPGSCLKMRASGKGADYETACCATAATSSKKF